MESTEQFTKNLNTFNKKSYVKKDITSAVKDTLDTILEHANKSEQKIIVPICQLMEQQRFKTSERNKIIDSKKALIKIHKNYLKEYNKEPDEDLTVNEIEQKLDQKIPRYNKFDMYHPMLGITYIESKKKYQVKYGDINTYAKNLTTACDKIFENFDINLTEISGIEITKAPFTYQKYFFMSYWYQNQPYFDIQHIISLLNLKKTSWNEKHNEFSDYIKYYTWHQNQYDGYILRELIAPKAMYKIALSSNSVFSQRFKNDIADILDDLRKKNRLIITDNNLQLKADEIQQKYTPAQLIRLEEIKLEIIKHNTHAELIKLETSKHNAIANLINSITNEDHRSKICLKLIESMFPNNHSNNSTETAYLCRR